MQAALPKGEGLRVRADSDADVPAAPAGVRSAARTGPSPLSFTQESIWFIGQLDGPNAVHNMARAFRIIGHLDVPALERSLQALVERHESLRTAFEQRDGLPVQVVLPAAEAAVRMRLSVRSMRGEDSADREQELGERLQAEACERFDLTCAPLLRARLFRLHEGEHVLLLVAHEIAVDGWSMAVLLRELGALYVGRGKAPNLPAPPLQFVDFVDDQRKVVAGDAMGAALQYWRQRLGGVESLELATDRPRPARFNYRGRVHRFSLPPSLCEPLRGIARAEQVSVFVLLLAAFKLLLHRYSRQSDLAIGVTVAGRRMAALDAVVGCFANTLVLRTDVSGNPRFSELLARVQRTVDEAHAHQDLPFDLLVTALSPKRDLGRNPLYQVGFALKRADVPGLSVGGLQVVPVAVHTETAKLDLALSVTEQADGGMHGVLEYAIELFDGATVARMAGHLRVLLQGIAASPAARLADLPLLGAPERAELLQLGNSPMQHALASAGLHQLIAAQAQRSPAADAVLCGGQRLSYRELDARAERMARRLRRLGVERETPVALSLRRSFHTPVMALAILKAGGVYVPIDPDDTAERRAFVLEDSGARLFVTQTELAAQGVAGAVRLLLVDADAEASDGDDSADGMPLAPGRPDDLAYVIYTSGSTGRPKGVQITHRGVCNHARWIARVCGIGPADRLLHKTSIGFDASIVELLMPLTCGATVVLAEVDGERDTDSLLGALAAHRITVLQMVPTALRMLLQEPRLERCESLRYLICGGEALDRELAREVRRLLPRVVLGNFYGPTEASIDATWHEVGEPPAGAGTVPIGRPVANARCRVLDAQGGLLPIGVPGELCIGGAGLARGYLNRASLNAERFVADPYRSGERLYRSGDLARWLADGSLEYLGRLDDQVKLRGYRIELGEVEAALLAVPGVTRCAVALREDRPGVKQLVAYVVGEVDDLSGLRERLRQRLPEHMLPSAVMRLEALPMLPSGKLDRRALPAPGQERRVQWLEPATATERALATLWCELLGVERVGSSDDFFELGGHSLLASRLVRRVEQQLQRHCSLAMLFRARTLQRIAAELDIATPAGDDGQDGVEREARVARATERAELLALQPDGDGPALFCICGIHLYQQLADRLAPHARVYGIFLPYEQALLEAPSTDSARLPSVQEMAADYVQAIRSQQPNGPYYLTGVSYGGVLAFEIAQQLQRAGEHVAFLAMLDSLLARTIPRDWLLWVARRLQRARRVGWKRAVCGVAARLAGAGRGRRGRPLQDPSGSSYVQIVAIRDRIYDLAMQDYVPQPYGGPAILVRAEGETFDAADGVDPSYGWRELVPRLVIHDTPGDHLGILSEPNVASLAAYLGARISIAASEPVEPAPKEAVATMP